MNILIAILLLSPLGSWAQDRSTEPGEAAIRDPEAECTPYDYPPLSAQRDSFPPSWIPAKILPNDTEGQQLWQKIVPSIPNIPVKPAPDDPSNGNSSTYGADDSDCWWTRTQCVVPKLSGLPPDIADVPEPSTLGYGFDDGPNCSHNAFYDYLASKNQKATMFFIGSNILDWPLETQRALTDGHEICVHTWSHRAMTSLSSPDAFAELYYSMFFIQTSEPLLIVAPRSGKWHHSHPKLWMQLIKLVAGVTPTCWRPPYGDVDDRIRAIANALGLRTILWKFDTFDWQFGESGITKEQIDANYQGVIDKALSGTFSSNGAIILSHEINNFTMQEAVDYLERLGTAFKYIVPVAVAMNKTQPYVETNYTLPTFEQYINGLTMVNQTSIVQVNASQTTNQPEAPTGSQLSDRNAAGKTAAPFTHIFAVTVSAALYILF